MRIPGDILIEFENNIEELYEFKKSISDESLSIHLNERKRGFKDSELGLIRPEFIAAISVVVFIAKSYFDAFLKEMGKNHYNILRSKLSKLSNKIPDTVSNSTAKWIAERDGAINTDVPSSFSDKFSICVELDNQVKLMLLLPKDNERSHAHIISNFLDYVKDIKLGKGTLEDIGYKHINANRETLYVHMNYKTKAFEIVKV